MHLLIVPPLFAFFFHTFFVFVYTRNHAGVFTVFTCIYVSVFWTGVSDSGSSCSLFSLLSQSILCTAGRRGVNNPLFQHRPQKSLAQIQNSTQLHIPDTDENTDTLLFSNVLTLAYAVPNTGHQPCLKSCFQENLISIWVPLFSVEIPASLNQQFFQHRLLCVLQLNFELQHFPVRQIPGNSRKFTHPNSSFEYVSDFSNFVFGDVVLFSKCLSHDFFTFSFAFCFFSQPLLVFPFDCSIDKRFVFILCEVGRIYIRNIQFFADFFCFFCQARPSFFSLFIVDFVCQGSPFQASYVKDKH